jgi:hypothetical protein
MLSAIQNIINIPDISSQICYDNVNKHKLFIIKYGVLCYRVRRGVACLLHKSSIDFRISITTNFQPP